MSASKEREKRREERLQAAGGGERSERRQRLVKLGSATAFLAIVVVAVLIVIGQSQSGGGDTEIEGGAAVRTALDGLPQRGLVLGDPKARVTLVEFGDLQCPACKTYAEEVLPQVIESRIRAGQARLEFRNYTIIGEESIPAGAAAIAAGAQGRGWNFVELFYRNQGFERSGYVIDSFLTSIAEGAGIPDIERWNRERKSERVLAEVSRTTAEAERLGLSSTPSFAVEGPRTAGLEPISVSGSPGELEAAIDGAR